MGLTLLLFDFFCLSFSFTFKICTTTSSSELILRRFSSNLGTSFSTFFGCSSIAFLLSVGSVFFSSTVLTKSVDFLPLESSLILRESSFFTGLRLDLLGLSRERSRFVDFLRMLFRSGDRRLDLDRLSRDLDFLRSVLMGDLLNALFLLRLLLILLSRLLRRLKLRLRLLIGLRLLRLRLGRFDLLTLRRRL